MKYPRMRVMLSSGSQCSQKHSEGPGRGFMSACRVSCSNSRRSVGTYDDFTELTHRHFSEISNGSLGLATSSMCGRTPFTFC